PSKLKLDNLENEECDEQVNNFSSLYYKKFSTIEEANEEFERYHSKIKRKKEKLNSNDKIVIYTDGSHKDNQKGSYAGIGVYYEDGRKKITESLPGDLQTNNRAELYAVIRALETCKDQFKIIEIKSDSRFVDVKNKDLFEKIDFLLTKRPGQVYFTHVFGYKGVTGNKLADKLAKQGATIKMNENTQDSTNKDVVLSKKEQFWWFKENENTNYRRPFIFTDDEGHITEYIQLKLSDKQNALLDKEHREFLKRHKFVLDRASNIIEETTKEYLLELLYPEAKLANIKFKNSYSFDLRICNIEIA
ncbi:32372_t:CDS:2, partial [Racocetra persica]